MKKYLYCLLLLILIVVPAACVGQKTEETPVKEEPKKEEPAKETPADKDPITEPETEPDESIPPEPKIYENVAFKDVIVTEAGEQFVVTGKAQVFEGVFQYKLHDGEQVSFENFYQTDGAPAWGDFEISFDKNLVMSEGAIFELFVYSAKDGSVINVLEIPIEPVN